MPEHAPLIAVCGAGEATGETRQLAERVGQALAERGAIVLSGGLGGVMEACCKGAKLVGGLTVGILPGTDPRRANPYVDVPIASGMSHGRNAIIVHTADALLVLPGMYGTLSEIALALAMGKPVIGLGDTWDVTGIERMETLEDAIDRVLAAADTQGRVGRTQ